MSADNADRYLEDQAAQAQTAMQNMLSQLQRDLMQAADLNIWVKRHPWAAVGAAAATGFVAADVMLGKKRNAAQSDEVESDEDRSSGSSDHDGPKRNGDGKARDERNRQATQQAAAAATPGWIGMLLASLFEVAKTGFLQWMKSAMQSPAGPLAAVRAHRSDSYRSAAETQAAYAAAAQSAGTHAAAQGAPLETADDSATPIYRA